MNVTIKGLTLYQPWASLVAAGAKRYETRSWGTPYRGRLAIHAAKKPCQGEMPIWTSAAALRARQGPPEGTNRDVLFQPIGNTYGKVLALANLVDCRPMEAAPDAWEDQVGEFGPGRWAWELADVQPLLEPVPVQGQRQLWDLPAEALALVLEQLPGDDPLPCPTCHKPMDAKFRCWRCEIRLCACGATINTPFISVCRICEVREALAEGRVV